MSRSKYAFGVLIILMLFFYACSDPTSAKIDKVMQLAEDNSKELQKVLDYYADDKEKLDAARYLIANMADKYSLVNRSNKHFLPILSTIDSLWTYGNAAIMDNQDILKAKWDSLSLLHGAPHPNPQDRDFDFVMLDANFLIRHIDHVFASRKTVWAEKVDKDIFYEYLLAYRVGTEALESRATVPYAMWSPRINEKGLDSLLSIATFINDYNAQRMSHMGIFWSYPYDFNTTRFERLRKGSCRHGVVYTAQVLRSLGIPTAVDIVRKWAGARNGHEWNVIFAKDGVEHPFDALHKGLKIDLSWRQIAKVYRKTFSKQDLYLDKNHIQEIPKELIDYNLKDVTHHYVKTTDVSVPMANVKDNKYAIICTYNGFEWEAQDWGEIENGHAVFKNIGVKNLYSVALCDRGSYRYRSEPFYVDSLGHLQQMKANYAKMNDMILERKAPLTAFMKGIMSMIVGNKIQGATHRDFRDSVTFFTIDKMAERIESVPIEDSNRYRYVRMWIPEGGRGDVAELEFYGISSDGRDTVKLTGDIIGDKNADVANSKFYQHPFDGDLLTYFLAPKKVDPWIGLDLGKPQRIVKVRYCPRSDTNFIEVGDEYELYLWYEGQWKSVRRTKATDQRLIFQNMPSGALFILVNTSKGKEHKIFTYRNGKQVWM